MTLHEEIQFEQTNRSHRSLLHYGLASSPSSSSSSPSASSSSSQLQQAHSHHRRIRVDEIMNSLALYCGPSAAASPSSSSSSLSASLDSSSAAFESTRALHFWNRGHGLRQSGVFIQQGIEYNIFPPEWLIPTQSGILITRDMIACQSKPDGQLRTPINVVGIGIAVEEEVERRDPQIVDAKRVHGEEDHTAGLVDARGAPNSASKGYRTAVAQLQEYQQQRSNTEQGRLTLGQAGVQLAKKATSAYETEMRSGLSSWSSSELRYLLHALEQYAKVRSVFVDPEIQLNYPLYRYSASDNSTRAISYATIINSQLDSLRRPMFVLCRWSSPLTSSRDDARPPNASPRLSYPPAATEDDIDYWDDIDYYRSRKDDIDACARPNPMYDPHGADPDSRLPSSDRIAQLSSLVRACPWPIQSEVRNVGDRNRQECRTAAHYLVESCLRIPAPTNQLINAHLPELGLRGGWKLGENEGAGWRQIVSRQAGGQLSDSECQVLHRAMPGAFIAETSRESFYPFPIMSVAPIAPNWCLALVSASTNIQISYT